MYSVSVFLNFYPNDTPQICSKRRETFGTLNFSVILSRGPVRAHFKALPFLFMAYLSLFIPKILAKIGSNVVRTPISANIITQQTYQSSPNSNVSYDAENCMFLSLSVPEICKISTVTGMKNA